jgi:hypothetical protein
MHVPAAASVVRDHGLLPIASAIHGGGQTPSSWRRPAIQSPLIRLVCGRSVPDTPARGQHTAEESQSRRWLRVGRSPLPGGSSSDFL